MNKILRLLLWADCPRKCKKCANNSYVLDNLPVCKDYQKYDTIILTGGEPTISSKNEELRMTIRSIIKVNRNVNLILYSAGRAIDIISVWHEFDGITYTIYDSRGIREFHALATYLNHVNGCFQPGRLRCKSFALEPIGEDEVYENWEIIEDMQYLDVCQVPETEDFMKLK